ncbi:MAG: M12 family metallo-peptidase, partial [Flavobacteriaceae bacterium]|nr:M12 family metallo-peptidase [Flavobacteriaceae bacterium]
MNKNYIKLFSIFLFLFANQIFAQQKKLWIKIDEVKISNTQLERKVNIKKYQTFQLEISDFRNKLQNTPTKNSVLKNSKFKIQFPNEYGKMISFWVKEAPVMHPDLAKKFSNNKSYIGIGVEDNTLKIRFSVNELGLHAMIITKDRKVQYINPVTKDKRKYKIFARENLSMESVDFQCFSKNFESLKKSPLGMINRPNDLKLRTYRLALAATAEYSQFHIDAAGVASGTNAQKKSIVMATMTTAVTRMNSILENDLSITMEIVANNENLIFLDNNTSPYTNNNGSAMLNQNQTTCDNVIGVSNYDIGHVLSTDGKVSRASLSSVCISNRKARGVTGSDNPTGDSFYFDFIIHEIGHQLGANHTFNGNAANCAGANRNYATAVEPGSGSTLMAYASLCSPQNVQQHSDLYFHTISIDEIWENIISGTNNCGTTTNLVTNLNVPTANAGNDFTIPKSTPYKLTGQANDADGDPITFCWEQMNNGLNNIPPRATDVIGTLYRSVNPSTENTRYLPRLNTVLDGNLSSKWEVTPSVARVMDFRLTIRDNNAEGGQVEADEMKVTVTDAAGPFKVTSQNTTDIVWNDGASETITWDVAGTAGNGINVSNVNILLSIDGGRTFPIALVSNKPNNVSQNITVPNNSAPNCKIMMKAIDNI